MDHTLANRYQLLESIGSGAMGDIYKATDTQTGATVAIKHLKPEVVKRDPEMLARFKREGEALRDLNHPNIVTLMEVVEESDENYIVMEYVSGGDLAYLIGDSPGGLPVTRVLQIALDLADALTRAHRLNIIHRDIKPANILLARDGTPRLTDFGIAHFGDESVITQTGMVIGTYAYLSPEACMGLPLDASADIWAFGVVLFEMLIGQRPFEGDSPGAIITGILTNPLPDSQEARAEISDGLNDLLYRMLTKNREERIPSVRLVGAELEALIKGVDFSSTSRPVEKPKSVFATPTPDVTERPNHNLPRQATELVGRAQELKELASLIADAKQPLITILGLGGMGKSRLALEVGERNLDQFRNGAFFVELAPLSDPVNMPTAIAEATDFRFTDNGTPEEQILNYLANKQMLLILDNFEHLLAGRDLVTKILQAAPEVTVLATSRTRLNLSGETVFTLDPLDFPDWETPEDALRYSAVQLFMQSARRVRINFEIAADELDYLARVCRLVGGIPLGILLAAAWVDTLSVEDIAHEIQKSFDFLESDLGDLPERQRSMRAAFSYSWNLLTGDEQVAFAKMSVFRGGCTRQAAQQVTGASLRMLTALVNKSLLRRDAESGRFQIHELLRQLGEEYLESSGQADSIRDAHSAYYLTALAEREADLKGRDQLHALEDVESDFENVRAAWSWAAEQRHFDTLHQAIFSLYCFCSMRSRFGDFQPLVQQGYKKLAPASGEESHPLVGRLLAWDVKRLEPLEQALAIARHHQDQPGEAFALFQLGVNVMEQQHDFKTAIGYLDESLALYDRWNDAFFIQLVEEYRSDSYIYLGDIEQAREVNRHGYQVAKAGGNRVGEARALSDMGVYLAALGRVSEARPFLEEGIAIRRESGDRGGQQFMMSLLAMLYIRGPGDIAQAKKLLAEAFSLSTEVTDPLGQGTNMMYQSWIACLEEDYQHAQQLAEKAYVLAESHPVGHDFYTIAMGLAACGLNEYEAARKYLGDCIRQMVHPSGPAIVIPALALVLAHEGQQVRAIELISLAQHTSRGFAGWYQLEPQMNRLLVTLKEELGEEAYQAAWERGEALDLETVMQELTQEFGEENNE